MPTNDARIMPPNTGVPTLRARQLRGAVGDDQRVEAEDEGERGHHHRAEAQPGALGRRVAQRHAALALLLGEFDDQDAVLRGEADQHDHADLRVEIERQARRAMTRKEPKTPMVTESSTGTGMVQLS